MTEDCATLNPDFVNSVTLESSKLSGFYYGKLADETKRASYDLCLKVYTSGYFKEVKNLGFTVCSPDTIIPSEEIVLKQWVFVGDKNMKFLIPKYINSDPSCPKVISQKVHT